MKNLKRILSLALASVMVMGMMVVGASAAEFNDQAQIDHQTAVNTLYALGVISGKENNNFDPKGNLTRAEMATVLAVVLNKGKAPNFGTKPTPTYTDIDNHWAESYIEYCSAFGVVGGIGGGKYDPDGTLTATQAARMILNAMGYTIEDPSNWALLTEAQARGGELDLYNGIDNEIADPTNAKITRDQMAQMLFNALSAPVVDKNGNTITYTKAEQVTEEGAPYYVAKKDGVSSTELDALAGRRFASWTEAWAVATSVQITGAGAQLGTHFEITSTSTTRTVTTTELQTLGNRYLGITETTGIVTSVKVNPRGGYNVAVATGASTTVGFSYVAENVANLMGQTVKVLYKGGNRSDVYGVFAAAGSVIFEGTVGDFTAMDTSVATQETVTLGGVEYPSANSITAVEYNNATTSTTDSISKNTTVTTSDFTNITPKAEYGLKAIDTNGDGKIDRMVVTPVIPVRVTNVTATGITTSPALGAAGAATLSLKALDKAVTAYEGIAKNDIALATPKANAVSDLIELNKAETVSGDVVGVDTTTSTEMLINGTWYKVADGKLVHSTPAVGTENVTLTLVNGKYYAYAGVGAQAAVAPKLVFITRMASAQTSGYLTAYHETVAYFLEDGTTQTIKVAAKTSGSYGATDVNKLYSYKENNGLYTLTPVADGNVTAAKALGFSNVAVGATAAYSNTTVGGMAVADDARVIIFNKNVNKSASTNTITAHDVATSYLTKVTEMTGADLKKWGGNATTAVAWGTPGNTVVFSNTINGIEYAKLIILAADAGTLPNESGTAGNYGYVVSNPYITVDGVSYQLWNGEETVTVNDTTTGTPAAIGKVITYTDNGNGNISGVSVVIDGTATTNQGAIIGYSASDKIISLLKGTQSVDANKIIDDKTVILYVNNTTKKAGGDVGIPLADEDVDTIGKYFPNCFYTLDNINGGTSNHVAVLVIDETNRVSATALDNRATVDLTALNTPTSNWSFQVFTDDPTTAETISSPILVKAGETIIVEATCRVDSTDKAKGFKLTDDATSPNTLVDVNGRACSLADNTGTAWTTSKIVRFEIVIPAGGLTVQAAQNP